MKPEQRAEPRRASWRQVASTMFWALFMIGRKDTWERDGATISPLQAVVGAIVALIVVVGILLLLARVAIP